MWYVMKWVLFYVFDISMYIWEKEDIVFYIKIDFKCMIINNM